MSNNFFPINDQQSPFSHNKSIHSIKAIHKPYRHPTVPFKTQLLNASLYTTKDNTHQRPLPELFIQEKKPIHGRSSISKTRTLPYLKILENEAESKTFEKKPENFNLEAIKMKIKKKVKVSIKNVKIKSNFNENSRKSSKIDINVIGCEDLEAPKVVNLRTPHHLFMPSVDASSSSSKKSRRGGFGTPSLSPARSDRIKQVKDCFYFLNYLRYFSVTSFYSILEAATDSSLNSFPYYTRIIRKYSKFTQIEKKPITHEPKAYQECICNKQNNENFRKAKLLKIKKLKTLIPHLHRIAISMQPAEFPNNLLILNFENVIGSFTNELCIKPGILKLIKKLSQYFRVVLVIALEEFKQNAVISFIEKQKIYLSGVYKLNYPHFYHQELKKMLDYCEIYKDFSIFSPEQQVLVITAHRILEHTSNSDYISTKKGLSHKLNVERPPVPSLEYENSPITILLPNFQMREHLNIIKNLVKLVKKIPKTEGFRFIDFRNTIGSIADEVVRNDVIHQILISTVRNPDKCVKSKKKKVKNMSFCKLHKKNVRDYEEIFCVNSFLI